MWRVQTRMLRRDGVLVGCEFRQYEQNRKKTRGTNRLFHHEK